MAIQVDIGKPQKSRHPVGYLLFREWGSFFHKIQVIIIGIIVIRLRLIVLAQIAILSGTLCTLSIFYGIEECIALLRNQNILRAEYFVGRIPRRTQIAMSAS